MNLREATRVILASKKPDEQLKLADMYIDAYNKMPSTFVLPAQMAALKPLVDTFHANLDSFTRYARALRDALPPGSERSAMHQFYRTLNTRLVQRVGRSRDARALAVVEEMLHRELDPDERDRVLVKLNQFWSRRRREFLEAARRSTEKGRLNTDERSTLLVEFWAQIDEEIERRELPMFKP